MVSFPSPDAPPAKRKHILCACCHRTPSAQNTAGAWSAREKKKQNKTDPRHSEEAAMIECVVLLNTAGGH